MKSSSVKITGLLLACCLFPAAAFALIDNDPPFLTSLTPETTTVNMTSAELTEVEILVVAGDNVSGIRDGVVLLQFNGETIVRGFFDEDQLEEGTFQNGTYKVDLEIIKGAPVGTYTIGALLFDASGNGMSLQSDELIMAGLPGTVTIINRGPTPYLWATDYSFPDGWRNLDWFGWLRDEETFPYVLHSEHGWIYATGSDLDTFYMYDFSTSLWWAIIEEYYPFVYVYANQPRWLYYYAPFGSPGNRWFYDFADGTDKREGDLGS